MNPPSTTERSLETDDEVRQYCRNPHCRSKLPTPVSNPREAFCTRGCYISFYLHRCLVCERRIEQPKRGKRLICKNVKCRSAFRNNCWLGRYHTSSAAKSTSKEADFVGSKQPLKPDRPWRIAAGQELSAAAIHRAAIGGEVAVEAVNRTNLSHWREVNANSEEKTLIKRHHPPVNVLGGHKYPGAPFLDLAPTKPAHSDIRQAERLFTDDRLDIPDFLRRTARPPEAPAAQNLAPPAAFKKTSTGGKAGQSATRAQRPRRGLRGRS